MTTAPEIPALCPGGTVVCLATGPSLTAADVDACRERATVVAINDAHRLAPWADVLYSSDQRWWSYYDGVPTFTGRKVGLEPLRPKPDWGITVVRNTGDAGLETDPHGLRNGRNSGYAAINLAVHLGAARILLLGYDMGRQPGQLAHFFGNHPERLHTSSPFPTFLDRFKTIVQPLTQIGVAVINCTPTSALDLFPRASLAEALA